MPPVPPRAPQRPHTHLHHGIPREDPWFWLQDPEDPAVLAYLEAENAYAEAAAAHLADLRAELYAEMLARIAEDDASLPVLEAGWWTYTRTAAGLPYPIHCRRRDAPGAPEEIVLDENALAGEDPYFHLETFAISPDQRYVAWLEDRIGDERFTLRVKDLETGGALPSPIDGLKWHLAWASDSRTLLFTPADSSDRPYRICRWRIDAPPEHAAVLWEEPDPRFYLSVSRARSGGYLFLRADSKTTAEVRALDARRPQAPSRTIWPRRPGVEVGASHAAGRFYLRLSDDGPDFRLVSVPDDDPSAPPTEILAHRPGVFLERVDAFARHLVLWETEDAVTRLRVLSLADGSLRAVPLPGEVYALEPEDNPDFHAPLYRFTYSSPVQPDTLYGCDLATGDLAVLRQLPVPGFVPGTYVSRRIWARAPDGADVPLTLCHRDDLAESGPHPLLLTAYGAYGISYPADFSSPRLSLLDRGVVLAIAHVRGGSERGRRWYEAGRGPQKPNTFADLLAAAGHLVATGWTAPQKMALLGGSAGALAAAVALNRRPDLFAAAVLQVPFLDALGSMLDPDLPLTAHEYEEWGDPADPAAFALLRGYSPYEGLAPRAWPPVLVTAALRDSRVPFWDAAKWTAKLRTLKTTDTPLLLRVDLGAGHAGRSDRYGPLAETAAVYAFLLEHLGLHSSP